MSWGISPNATEKENIFADFNDSLNGMNCADGLSYYHYSKIYDIGRELADKEYEQGRADEKNRIEDEIVKCHNDSGMIEIQKVINIIEQVRGGE